MSVIEVIEVVFNCHEAFIFLYCHQCQDFGKKFYIQIGIENVCVSIFAVKDAY